MLLSAVYVLVVAQSSSEIPEGLMNNPVLALDYCVTKQLAVLHLGRFLVAVVQSCHEHGKEEAEYRSLG